ncbi:hypothetical protein FHN97_21400 [Salmonella enterica]|uniref:hypothetical protein n=1 Tax=Salmonella enterica TaxID=28901 RepID=UPI001119C20B|nr:hypothetical protein [Salmonella enterica]EBD0851810.1 hypothetical protein [Salmonella enterica]EBF2435367.1 hypothetical protein [Salmonella enterica]ECE2165594.1 hypothetical protein [Salmonella enterica]ECV6472772.1 hypothetical protein [Salmonella enterica]EDR5750800.1 hypothetical protein [Salmonella enterica subsp. enterica serovar Cubana]
MRLNNNPVKGILTVGVFLATVLTTTSAAQASDDVWTHITLRADFVAPRCNLTIPPEVNLGVLSLGEKTHEPVDITISCPAGAANSVLFAQGANLVSGSNGERVSMVNVTSQALADLWLKESGVNIKLDKTQSFCDGNATRVCKLNPVTHVNQGTSPGEIYAMINFSLEYP